MRDFCLAFKESTGNVAAATDDDDVEIEDCSLCAGWVKEVAAPLCYPSKKKKVKQRLQTAVAALVENTEGQFVMRQRPADGLLGNLWEFPLVVVSEEGPHLVNMSFAEQKGYMDTHLAAIGLSVPPTARRVRLAQGVNHTFSHIKQFVLGEHIVLPPSSLTLPEGMRLVHARDIPNSAVSKTTLVLLEKLQKNKSQPGIASFFGKK